MEQQREQVAHTSGPLRAERREHCSVVLQAGGKQDGYSNRVAECPQWSPAPHQQPTPDEAHGNARLFAAAYTSYDKHCGPRAVECAEGDLLGELIEAAKEFHTATQNRLNSLHSLRGDDVDIARLHQANVDTYRSTERALLAALSKALGKAG